MILLNILIVVWLANPLQYNCLANPMDGGAWQAAVHGVAKSQTQLHFHFSLSCIGEGNGNPLQCSCLGNPRDGGAWWAAIYGVTQSRTRLKRLSSSSSVYICQNAADMHTLEINVFHCSRFYLVRRKSVNKYRTLVTFISI